MRVLDGKELDQVSGGTNGGKGFTLFWSVSKGSDFYVTGAGTPGPTARQIELNRLRAAGNTDPTALADALGF